MDVVSLPQNTEGLLIYLLVTPDFDKRSREALQEMPNFDRAVAWLTENGYAYEYSGRFELTLAGMHAARQVQNFREMTTHTYVNNTEAEAEADEPRLVALPFVDAHPLRTRQSHRTNDQPVRYLLAFEKTPNVLPIPVLDGDVVGRDEAAILLGQDEYVSGQHCRFLLKNVDDHWILCVEDLGSRNGTLVNNRRLEPGQVVPLEHGSRLQIGSTMLKVVKIPD